MISFDEEKFQSIMAEPVNRDVMRYETAKAQERIESYKRRCAEHRMITYLHNGEVKYAVGRNETEARQRALIETNGDDFTELQVGPARVLE